MNPVLRCKMRVQSVAQYMNSEGKPESEQVKLTAVYGTGDSENAQWSKWTPAANFDIQINNPAAFGTLAKGGEFFVDFTPAE